MQIKSYKLEATVPTTQFGNLRPTMVLEGSNWKEMKEFALDEVKDLHSRFSETKLKETNLVSSESVRIKSFNEPGVVVDYKPNPVHEYSFEGKKLRGATSIVSDFTKPFDAQVISKNCEASWKVEAEAIQGMWKSNGNVSSDFGTAIHEALEHYFNYKAIGETIQKNTDKEDNPALPKHPLLKRIIQEFEEINKFKGEVLQEVLVTDVKNGRCGQIDRLVILDKEKKVCCVQDYKVNVGAEEITSSGKLKAPYNELPANKLSKYQLQMSVYAKMLENSGWTVDGLSAYVLEEGWKHYELKKVDI